MDEEIIRRLGDPACYPGGPGEVRIYQTHLSVVCVAGDAAYKLKKPVVLPFVNFSTVELREHFCHEEVRLNRRLCPDIYRGVVPLYRGPEGVTFCEAGRMPVVDHAVLMRRLPQERMMDALLARGEVSERDVKEIARIMAKFHGGAGHGKEVCKAGDPGRLRDFALENFSETRPQRGTVFDSGLHDLLEERTRRDFDRLLPVLERRAAEGRVVEGHGDLHARNICLTDPVAVYDCIEFNAGLRCEDVATENAFLAMDLLYRGHRELACAYLEAYADASGDTGQRDLMPALVRYRAMVRAKVSAIVASEPEIGEGDRAGALASARRHLNLCAASAVAEDGPLLVMTCGLPASGKTCVFEELARETGWPYLCSDRVRKELAGVDPEVRLPDAFYSADFSRRVYRALIGRGIDLLGTTPVLLDANFRSVELRRMALQMAREAVPGGCRVVVAWFRVEESRIVKRLAAKDDREPSVSDADLEVYRKLRKTFEAPSAEEGFELVVIDGAADRDDTLCRILRRLMLLPVSA